MPASSTIVITRPLFTAVALGSVKVFRVEVDVFPTIESVERIVVEADTSLNLKASEPSTKRVEEGASDEPSVVSPVKFIMLELETEKTAVLELLSTSKRLFGVLEESTANVIVPEAFATSNLSGTVEVPMPIFPVEEEKKSVDVPISPPVVFAQ